MEKQKSFLIKGLALIGAAYAIKKAVDYAVELEMKSRVAEWKNASECDKNAHYDMDGVSFDPEVKVVISSDAHTPDPEKLKWMSRARNVS